jgi:hypothetical protein
MKREGEEPRALRGAGRVAALGWVCAVVLLYLAVSELGVRVVP